MTAVALPHPEGYRPALAAFGLELRADAVNPRLVSDSWVRSYRRIHHPPGVTVETWYQGMRQIVGALMPLVHAAVRPGAPHTIHGWACGREGLLHYVYVPSELRCHGLGRALIEAVAGPRGTLTHQPPSRASSVFRGFAYDPFALFAPPPTSKA